VRQQSLSLNLTDVISTVHAFPRSLCGVLEKRRYSGHFPNSSPEAREPYFQHVVAILISKSIMKEVPLSCQKFGLHSIVYTAK